MLSFDAHVEAGATGQPRYHAYLYEQREPLMARIRNSLGYCEMSCLAVSFKKIFSVVPSKRSTDLMFQTKNSLLFFVVVPRM